MLFFATKKTQIERRVEQKKPEMNDLPIDDKNQPQMEPDQGQEDVIGEFLSPEETPLLNGDEVEIAKEEFFETESEEQIPEEEAPDEPKEEQPEEPTESEPKPEEEVKPEEKPEEKPESPEGGDKA